VIRPAASDHRDSCLSSRLHHSWARRGEGRKHADGIGIGDFDGDANLDLAVGNNLSGTVSLLFNEGSGAFAGPVHTDVDGVRAGLVVTDFNGDAKPDVAVTSSSGVAVLLHN
jgi:hypothetical protein